MAAKVSATSLFDNRLRPIEQSIYGNAQFMGSNLSVVKDKVLPKWVGRLLFGRKKYINIDSLKVYITVDEDVARIYPFETDINKYRFYVSGMQNFNDSFFYHLTLLKWFLPFKLAFNIYGKPDNLHIKPACAKNENITLPSKILNVKARSFIPEYYVPRNIENASIYNNKSYNNFVKKYNAIFGNNDLKDYRQDRTRIINQLDNEIENKKIKINNNK